MIYLRWNSKIEILSTSKLTPIYGGASWYPCRVCQPNYFVWFVFYVDNGHFWSEHLAWIFIFNIPPNFKIFPTEKWRALRSSGATLSLTEPLPKIFVKVRFSNYSLIFYALSVNSFDAYNLNLRKYKNV